MSATVRVLQILSVVAFLVAGLMVSLQIVQTPRTQTHGVARAVQAPRRPIPEMGEAVRSFINTQDPQALWRVRLWYPWAAAVFWLGALLWAYRGPRARVQAGVFMALLTIAIVVLEAAYLYHDYAPFLPGTAGTIEAAAVFVGVAFLLLYRRRADRQIGAVEAAVASQAMLGFVRFLTLPSTMARPWFEVYPLHSILNAVFANFRLPFWIGCGALLVASVPVYLSRRRVNPTARSTIPG